MVTKAQKAQKNKAQKVAPRPPKIEVKVTSVLGEPSIEELEGGRQVVLWMSVEGHGRIRVQSTTFGVFRASAADPAAGFAAEAGAGEYCEQHGEALRQLYAKLA